MADVFQMSMRGAYVNRTPSLSQVVDGLLPYFNGTHTLDQVVPGLMQRLNPRP